jgi:hypothetical protein
MIIRLVCFRSLTRKKSVIREIYGNGGKIKIRHFPFENAYIIVRAKSGLYVFFPTEIVDVEKWVNALKAQEGEKTTIRGEGVECEISRVGDTYELVANSDTLSKPITVTFAQTKVKEIIEVMTSL